MPMSNTKVNTKHKNFGLTTKKLTKHGQMLDWQLQWFETEIVKSVVTDAPCCKYNSKESEAVFGNYVA